MSSMLQCVTPITRTGIDSTVRTLFGFSVQNLIFSVSSRHAFLLKNSIHISHVRLTYMSS